MLMVTECCVGRLRWGDGVGVGGCGWLKAEKSSFVQTSKVAVDEQRCQPGQLGFSLGAAQRQLFLHVILN
jgi:hypothetical protein